MFLAPLSSWAAFECDGTLNQKTVPLSLGYISPNHWILRTGGGPFYYTDSYDMAGKIEADLLSVYGDAGIIAMCGREFLPTDRRFTWWPGCNSGTSQIIRTYRVQEDPVPEGYTRIAQDDGVPIDVKCVTSCKPPFTLEVSTGKCVKYCHRNTPILLYELRQCVPIEDKKPPLECKAGNPIVISTGEKTQSVAPDYQSNSLLPLYFQRDYRSNRAEESDIFWQQESSGSALNYNAINISQWIRYEQPDDYEPSDYIGIPLGWAVIAGSGSEELQPPVAGHKQWKHNYQSKLYETATRLIIDSPQGFKIFKPEGDIYVSTRLAQDKISSVILPDGSTGWHYYISPQYSEYYNSQGQLVRLEQSASIYQTLTYNTEGQLIDVTHSLGGSIQLAYNSEGQLSQLITPDNKTIGYSYDSRGNPTQVNTIFANGETRSRAYHYENDDLPFALTGITDEKGVRYASWTYNAQGQAIESVHAGGVDKTSFVFDGDNSTSVTNVLDKTTIYHYDTSTGTKRLASVEGVATANCAAANKAYSYYDNGLLQSKTDWQGSTTTYEYNAKHQQSSRTEAAGTAQARTISTLWHDTLNLPIQVTEPNRIINYSYDSAGRLLEKTITPINGAQGE